MSSRSFFILLASQKATIKILREFMAPPSLHVTIWTLLALRVHPFEPVDLAADLARASFRATSIGSWAGWEADFGPRGQYDDPVCPGRRTLTLEGRKGPKDSWTRTRSREGDVPIGRVVNLGECSVRAFSLQELDVVTCDVARDAAGIAYIGMKAQPPFVETRTCFSVAVPQGGGYPFSKPGPFFPLEERAGCIPALRRRISVDVKFDTMGCDVVTSTVALDRQLNSTFSTDMEEALFGPQGLSRSASDFDAAVAVENVFKRAVAFGYGDSTDDTAFVPSLGGTSVPLEPYAMGGRGGLTNGITSLELPWGIGVSFGPMRLLDGSVAAPSRRGAGVFLEIEMLGESSGGAKVRREFDVRGEIISVAAEAPGVS